MKNLSICFGTKIENLFNPHKLSYKFKFVLQLLVIFHLIVLKSAQETTISSCFGSKTLPLQAKLIFKTKAYD